MAKVPWHKINKTDSCWLWTGYKKQGYGHFDVKRKHIRAHRLVYEALVKKVPEGLQLDHLCRVRHCVNPRHLEPVTQKVNILRGMGTGAINARKTHCKRGHPFLGKNLRVVIGEKQGGDRVCRECVNFRQRLRRAKAA